MIGVKNKKHPIRKLYLQSEQQKKGLHAVETSVHKVTHEQIVGLWNISAHLQMEGD